MWFCLATVQFEYARKLYLFLQEAEQTTQSNCIPQMSLAHPLHLHLHPQKRVRKEPSPKQAMSTRTGCCHDTLLVLLWNLSLAYGVYIIKPLTLCVIRPLALYYGASHTVYRTLYVVSIGALHCAALCSQLPCICWGAPHDYFLVDKIYISG